MAFPFEFRYHLIKPETGQSPERQLADCFDKLRAFIGENNILYPVSFIWFFEHSDIYDCEGLTEIIEESGISGLIRLKPTIIAQAPADGTAFHIMILCVENTGNGNVEYSSVSDNPYVSIKADGQHWAFINVDGCKSRHAGIRQNAEYSFSLLDSIFSREGLSFKDIVRQWNYIPDIVDMHMEDDILRQNYQEFNEVRGKWYSIHGLDKDFPAATGIGTAGNMVRLEVIAARTGKKCHLITIHNPVQQNAHQYSSDKLVGSIKKSTPLFERAKMVFCEGRGHIWVSGTAAIRGEESVEGDLAMQTVVTCDNIDQLIRAGNLQNAGLPKGGYEIQPVYVRAYVKFRYDGPQVHKLLETRYPGALIHVLTGDVCRDELLVEVEAEFTVLSI